MTHFDPAKPNALNLFRLILACLVIVSHSPELLDGNQSRELLKGIFGTLTIGQVAVYGFFFISGFLIVDSAFRNSFRSFMLRRALRIVPGFVVAYLLSITLVFWLGGGSFDELSPGKWAAKVAKLFLLLNPAEVGTAFAGSHSPDVNGSLWTIAYEFRCYVLAGLIALMFGRNILPYFVLAVGLALVLLLSLSKGVHFHFSLGNFDPVGNVDDAVRFTMMFSIGALFQLCKDRIPNDGFLALACLILLVAGLFSDRFAPIAVGIFGGYLILFLAFASGDSIWSSLNRKDDVSYGIYLYAWPIQKLLILHNPAIAPMALTALTVPLAATAGLLSWHFVEKPALNLRGRGCQLTSDVRR